MAFPSWQSSDPESLDSDPKFKEELAKFEAKNGLEARNYIEKYIRANVQMNALKAKFEADYQYYNEIFESDEQMVKFMSAVSVLIGNTMSVVSLGTLSTVSGSVFMASLFKLALITGFMVKTGRMEGETLPDAFDDFIDAIDFNVTIDDDEEPDGTTT